MLKKIHYIIEDKSIIGYTPKVLDETNSTTDYTQVTCNSCLHELIKQAKQKGFIAPSYGHFDAFRKWVSKNPEFVAIKPDMDAQYTYFSQKHEVIPEKDLLAAEDILVEAMEVIAFGRMESYANRYKCHAQVNNIAAFALTKYYQRKLEEKLKT